jgi:hypothetical protein
LFECLFQHGLRIGKSPQRVIHGQALIAAHFLLDRCDYLLDLFGRQEGHEYLREAAQTAVLAVVDDLACFHVVEINEHPTMGKGCSRPRALDEVARRGVPAGSGGQQGQGHCLGALRLLAQLEQARGQVIRREGTRRESFLKHLRQGAESACQHRDRRAALFLDQRQAEAGEGVQRHFRQPLRLEDSLVHQAHHLGLFVATFEKRFPVRHCQHLVRERVAQGADRTQARLETLDEVHLPQARLAGLDQQRNFALPEILQRRLPQLILIGKMLDTETAALRQALGADQLLAILGLAHITDERIALQQSEAVPALEQAFLHFLFHRPSQLPLFEQGVNILALDKIKTADLGGRQIAAPNPAV